MFHNSGDKCRSISIPERRRNLHTQKIFTSTKYRAFHEQTRADQDLLSAETITVNIGCELAWRICADSLRQSQPHRGRLLLIMAAKVSPEN
jgi:hypothetical protein